MAKHPLLLDADGARGSLSERVSFRLDPDTHARLEAVAERDGIANVGIVARDAMLRGLSACERASLRRAMAAQDADSALLPRQP